MLRRLFWLVAGVAVGAWGTTKVNRAARKMTPGGLAETAAGRAADVGGRLRSFAKDVRTGMAEREDELNRTLGRDAQGSYTIRPGLPGRAVLPAPHRGGDHHHPATDRDHHRKEGH